MHACMYVLCMSFSGLSFLIERSRGFYSRSTSRCIFELNRIYACVYICMYACMYVCMYVYIYTKPESPARPATWTDGGGLTHMDRGLGAFTHKGFWHILFL